MENNNFNSEDEVSFKVKNTRRLDLRLTRSCGSIVVGLLLAKLLVPSIEFGGIFSFAGLVFSIWILNLILKPFLILITLPMLLFTLGAGMIFVDALVIYISTWVPGIRINTFWVALLMGFLIELASWCFTLIETKKIFKNRDKKNDDDVIDV